MNEESLKILVYRRTHRGDPDKNGIFGICDCMGSVRNWEYDAVIGIGGVAPWPEDKVIAKKITWIGISPTFHDPTQYSLEEFKGKWVTFEKFILFDEKGKLVSEIAPKLHEYMFERGHIRRIGKNFPDDIYGELLGILRLADDAEPSKIDSMKKLVKKSSCNCLKDEISRKKC